MLESYLNVVLVQVISVFLSQTLWVVLLTSHTSKSEVLWEDLCRYTGKTVADVAASSTGSLGSSQKDRHGFFRSLYHNVPCVPVDFPSLSEALEMARPGVMITVQPGVYEERLVIERSVRIRAVDPVRGATLVWYRQPSHRHSSQDESDGDSQKEHWNESLVEIKESCTSVSLQNLTLLHYSEGIDVWNGNCAVYCHGHLTRTCLQECSVQSDSGRGIVVSEGATAVLIRSSIHDCAATGVYVGGHGSSVHIISSNILRNGFGRRSLQDAQQERLRSPGIQEGHSGMYVEMGDAEILNTLIAENCRTGLSVVRAGSLQLCHNVFIGRSNDHIQVFREDVTEEDEDDDESWGATYEVSNLFEFASPTPEEMEATWIRYPGVGHRRLSRNSLLDPRAITMV